MVWIPQERFSFGELSPRMLGMGSSEQVRQGCKVLENAFLTTTGGVRRRPGTKFVRQLPTASGGALLVPYQASDESYMLVFDYAAAPETLGRLRVYDSDDTAIDWGGNADHGPYPDGTGDDTEGFHPLDVSSGPLYYFQYNNRVYILSQNKPPLYFEKVYGATSTFDFGIAPIHNGSPQLISYKPTIAITMEEGTTGEIDADRIITADTDLFEASDTDSGSTSFSLTNSIWRLGGAPQEMDAQAGPQPVVQNGVSCWFEAMTYLTPKKLKGKRITGGMGEDAYDWTGPYIEDVQIAGTLAAGNKYEYVALTNVTGASLDQSYVGRVLTALRAGNQTMLFWIASVTDSTTATLYCAGWSNNVTSTIPDGATTFSLKKIATRPGVPTEEVYAPAVAGSANVLSGDFTLHSRVSNVLPNGHVTAFDGTGGTATLGGSVFVAGGAGRATSSANANTYSCTGSTDRAYFGPTFNWGYGYSLGTGFPTCGASHQGRVFLSGFKDDIQNVLSGSRTGLPDDFILGANDDDALLFKIANNVGNGIRWMVSQQDLLIGTELAEFKMSGQPLTPTQVGVDLQSTYGSKVAMPSQIGYTTLFITRDGKGIRELGYNDVSQRYQSSDLTDFASHLWEGHTRGTTTYPAREIERVVMTSSPDMCLFAQGGSALDILTYRKESQVLGWSPTNLQNVTGTDNISDVAVLPGYPSGTPDRVYMVTNRLKGTDESDNKRCVEYLTDSAVLDSEITANSSSGSSPTISGLGHLAGRTVQALGAGGFYLGEFDVSAAGIITLLGYTGVIASVQVGLPFTFKATPAVQEIQGRHGYTHGHKRNYDRAILFLNKSRGVAVAGYDLQTLPLAGGALPDSMDGWTTVPVLGLYGTSPDLEITHNNPYTIEMQSISIEVSYSD
jgi:hypothetical protein|tara:strand:- start:7685 stop:10381 length:2697 start_codon:yes stop_codon:yes gene_type:complete